MSNTKLSVTIILPGRTMMSSQECDKNPKRDYKKQFIMLSVKKFDKKTKKYFIKNEPLEYYTRRCCEAQQVIRMTDEAYEYMTSSVCPEWFTPSMHKWKRMSELQRLEEHLDRICESLGGIRYTYDIYAD